VTACPVPLNPSTEAIMTLSEQARADAMADAETFLLNTTTTNDLRYLDLTRIARDMRNGLWRGRDATMLARAAFRAVPGLRGVE
jgi:hypothetical protein